MSEYDVLIIGGGPAGLTAGIYAARSKLKTVIIEKGALGGQIALTSIVENYPGYESISGQELVNKMAGQAKKLGVGVKEFTEVIDIDVENKEVKTTMGTFKGIAIIIATGTKEKKLGVKGEEELKGKGVSYCATCDGPFFKDKDVFVVGGGNSALEEAQYLTQFAKSVTIIHRREEFRAEKMIVEKVRNNDKIRFMLNSVVEEIIGKEKVEGIRIKNVKSGESKEMPADGIFIYIGMIPNTEFLKGKIELNEWGYIKVNKKRETNVEGIYAAGDVTDSLVKQITTATADGTIAAVFAEKYIRG